MPGDCDCGTKIQKHNDPCDPCAPCCVPCCVPCPLPTPKNCRERNSPFKFVLRNSKSCSTCKCCPPPPKCVKKQKCPLVSGFKKRCRTAKPVKCCCPCDCVSKW